MKIQIQRIGHTSDNYNHHSIDTRLMEGTVKSIRPGIELDVQFNRISLGAWHTTKITRVEYRGESMMLVHTKNSIYLIVKGWREN